MARNSRLLNEPDGRMIRFRKKLVVAKNTAVIAASAVIVVVPLVIVKEVIK